MLKSNFLIIILLFSVFLLHSVISAAETQSSFDKGKELYDQGKFHIALSFFQKAEEENPLNADVYFYLGNIYNHKELFDKAIDAFLKGIDLTDNKNVFYFNLARTYQSAKQYKKSIEMYRKLLYRTDKIPEIYYYLGLVNFELRIKNETISNLENYLAKAPRSPQYETIKKVIEYLKTHDEIWKKPAPQGAIQYILAPQGVMYQGQWQGGTPQQGISGINDLLNKDSQVQVQNQDRKEGPEFDAIEK